MLERLGGADRPPGDASDVLERQIGDEPQRDHLALVGGQLRAAPRRSSGSRGSATGAAGWSGATAPDEPRAAGGLVAPASVTRFRAMVNTQRRTALWSLDVTEPAKVPRHLQEDLAGDVLGIRRRRGLGGSRARAGRARRRSPPGSPVRSHRILTQDRRCPDPSILPCAVA